MSSEVLPRAAATALERQAPRRRKRRRPRAWHLVLAPLSLIFIFPFVQMVLASVLKTAALNAYPPSLSPHPPTLDAYRTVLQQTNFPTWFKTSVIVTTVAVISQLLLCPL